MVFVPFTGVDNHWSNVTFASALLENECHTNIEWALGAFNRCMDHPPPCVITDQCLSIKKAIRNVWPGAKHRFCMWHIMNKLSSKVILCKMHVNIIVYLILRSLFIYFP